MEYEKWDLFMTVFMGVDRIQHFFWKNIDPNHAQYSKNKMSHKFKNLHRELLREGKISSELNDYYARNFANGFLYWNGKSWVSTSTITAYGKNKLSN